METKQSSALVSDTALRLPGSPPALPADVLERFPSLRTWADEHSRFWNAAQNGMQDGIRATMDQLEIGGVFTVDPDRASIFIKRSRGEGAWADPDTPFYVDRDPGYFSLGAALTWNPIQAELIVSGTIYADAGEIGGFIIDVDNLRDAADSFGLSSVVTGGDDVRFYAGSTFAGRATAPFRVYESGIIVATSGTIGGFNLGTDYLRDVANTFGLASTVTGGDDVRLWAGDTFANRATAPFRVTEAGALTATSGAIGGFNIGADYIRDVGNSFGMASTVTGGVDVRFWAGDTFANRATAPLRFYEDGTGKIGGFTITANTLEAGSGGTYISLSSAGSIQVGDPAGLTSAIDPAQISIGNSSAIITWRVIDLGTSTVMEMWTSAGASSFSVTANTGNVVALGSVTAASFSGSGANLTTLNASNISSGTLANGRLPSAISVTSLTASGEIRGATARFGTFTGSADVPVTGSVSITDDGGTTRKLATIA